MIEIVVIVLVIIHVCISRIFYRQDENIHMDDISESIFVGIVAYRDNQWIKSVIDIILQASSPSRIFIGVVEYVDNISKSSIKYIPKQFRNNMRIHTLPSQSSYTLAKSRKILMQELYRNEKYVLFTKSVEMCNDWDESLCSQLRKIPAKSVIISHLKETNCFACVKSFENNNIELSYEKMKFVKTNMPIIGLCWVPEFSFCPSDIAHILYSDESFIGVSSLLYHNGIQIFYTEETIGIRSDHPHGVRCASTCKVTQHIIDAYLISIGIEDEIIKQTATLGLSPQMTVKEATAKYGSLKKAKFLLNNSVE